MRAGLTQDSAHYRIGPLTTYVDPAELDAWMRCAKPGDETSYAIGPSLSLVAATPKLARKFEAEGIAQLFLRRVGGGLHYMIRKREVACAAPAPISAIYPNGPVRALYDVICSIAEDGLPLPSNEVLAERAMLSDRHAVRYRINLLVGAGFIRMIEVDGQRVAEVPGVGTRTAALAGHQS